MVVDMEEEVIASSSLHTVNTSSQINNRDHDTNRVITNSSSKALLKHPTVRSNSTALVLHITSTTTTARDTRPQAINRQDMHSNPKHMVRLHSNKATRITRIIMPAISSSSHSSSSMEVMVVVQVIRLSS